MDANATSRRRLVYSGYVGSPSAADGQFGIVVPVKHAHVAYFGYAMDVGGSSGTNSVQLNRVRDETDTELLSATLDIENDATTVSAETMNTFQNNQLNRGDIVRGDVDELAGSGGGLAWTIILHVDAE